MKFDGIFNEEAAAGAVSSGAIAGFAPKLTSNVKKRRVINKKRKRPVTSDINTTDEPNKRSNSVKIMKFTDYLKKTPDLKEGIGQDLPAGTNHDYVDVEEKLRSAVRKSSMDNSSTEGFMIEDDDGKQYKIFVKADQADEFKRALDEIVFADDDENPTEVDVAEALFLLKDKFDIVDVEWPEIEEDEAEVDMDVNIEGGEEADSEEMPDGELGDEEAGDDTMDMDMEEPAGDSEAAATSALMQVIQAMQADAEARRVEAEAKKKEAEARIAAIEAQELQSEVSKQERLLDMESKEDKDKSRTKEIETLAKLARYEDEAATAGGSNPTMESLSFKQSITKKGV